MPRTTKQKPNLVLELGDTNIPTLPCKLPCVKKHYIVMRPEDYDKRKKTLKPGAKMALFTVSGKMRNDLRDAVIEDAKTFQFTK